MRLCIAHVAHDGMVPLSVICGRITTPSPAGTFMMPLLDDVCTSCICWLRLYSRTLQLCWVPDEVSGIVYLLSAIIPKGNLAEHGV